MSRILSIDTALNACGLAAIDEGKILFHHHQTMQNQQAEYLNPALQKLMQAAALKFSEIDAVAVTIGPGSFTGIRVGMAAAKGIAIACNIPLIGCLTTEVMARQIVATQDMTASFHIAIDSKRGDYFVQTFDHDGMAQNQISIWSIEQVQATQNIHINLDIDPVILARMGAEKFSSGDYPQHPHPFYGRDADAIKPNITRFVEKS